MCDVSKHTGFTHKTIHTMGTMRSTHKRPLTRLARTGVWLYTTAACISILTLAYIFCMLRQTGDLTAFDEDNHDDGFHDWTEQEAASLAAYHAVSKHQLLLASHNRLFWYNTETENVTVLHEGQGVHYGIFPGSWDSDGRRLRSVWNVVRPHNWHPSSSEELLLELDADTGEELQRMRLDARFTHDAVRRGDRVYVASTEAGSVLELAYPSMAPLRNISLYQRQQHINTLAPLSNTTLWAVLHNLGESAIVKMDTTPGRRPREMMRYPGVGHSAHGLVLYQQYFLLLDSQAARLVALDIVTGDITELWKAPDEGRFLKGLAVVDDVAYFGITEWAERKLRDSPSNDCELAAYDLATSSLMWRRKVPSHGLLNIIAAPHLGEQSSYAAVYSSAGGHLVLHDSDAMVEAFEHYVHSSQYPVLLGGQWASGRPFLNAEAKQTDTPWDAGLALPLVALDVSDLKARVASAPEAMWDPAEQRRSNALIDGRQDNMVRFKPGVQALMLLFSDQAGRRVFKFPYWDYFAAQMEPLLEEILGRADLRKLIRVQLARMPPGSTILTHQDMGGYAKEGHRIHIPLITHEAVSFQTCPQDILERCPEDEDVQQWVRDNAGRAATDPDAAIDLMPCVEIPAPEGMVFELNNRVPHRVLNQGDRARVHLVVDVAESPRVPRVLPPGTVCEYESGRTMCPGAVAEGGRGGRGGRGAEAARVSGSHVEQ